MGNYKAEVEDLRSVVLHWRAQGRDPVAILGHSKGTPRIHRGLTEGEDVNMRRTWTVLTQSY